LAAKTQKIQVRTEMHTRVSEIPPKKSGSNFSELEVARLPGLLKAINATHDPSDRGTIDWPLAGIGVKAKDEWLEVKKTNRK